MKTRVDVIPPEGPLLRRTEPGDVLFLLLRAHRVTSDAIDAKLRKVGGLSLPLWEVLVVLSHAPQLRLRMVDITRRMLVSKSNATKLVNRLVQAGLVKRDESASDRRVVYALLTPKGVEAVQRGGDLFNEGARELLGEQLTKTEFKAMNTGLSKIIAAATQDSG